MLANEKAKKAGLSSLNEMSKITGVSRHTLNNWNKANTLKFDIFLLGAVFRKFIDKHK